MLNPPAHTKFTPEAQRVACRVFAETASRSAAAEACGVSLRTIQRHYQRDATFREAMIEAKAAYVRILEQAAYERAVLGVTQSKPGPGGVFYDVTTYDTPLLLHLLKKMDPERHGDKTVVDVNHNDNTIGLDQLSPDARAKIRDILMEHVKPAELLASHDVDELESEDARPDAESEADLS